MNSKYRKNFNNKKNKILSIILFFSVLTVSCFSNILPVKAACIHSWDDDCTVGYECAVTHEHWKTCTKCGAKDRYLKVHPHVFSKECPGTYDTHEDRYPCNNCGLTEIHGHTLIAPHQHEYSFDFCPGTDGTHQDAYRCTGCLSVKGISHTISHTHSWGSAECDDSHGTHQDTRTCSGCGATSGVSHYLAHSYGPTWCPGTVGTHSDTRECDCGYVRNVSHTISNNPPSISLSSSKLTINRGEEVVISWANIDPDGDTLTTVLDGVSVTNTNSKIYSSTVPIEKVFKMTATDSKGAVSTKEITINVINRVPVITLSPYVNSVGQNQSTSLSWSSVDPDVDSMTAEILVDGIKETNTTSIGTFIFSSTILGIHYIDIKVTDKYLGEATQRFTVMVTKDVFSIVALSTDKAIYGNGENSLSFTGKVISNGTYDIPLRYEIQNSSGLVVIPEVLFRTIKSTSYNISGSVLVGSLSSGKYYLVLKGLSGLGVPTSSNKLLFEIDKEGPIIYVNSSINTTEKSYLKLSINANELASKVTIKIPGLADKIISNPSSTTETVELYLDPVKEEYRRGKTLIIIIVTVDLFNNSSTKTIQITVI